MEIREKKDLPLGWLLIGLLSLVAFLSTSGHGQAVTHVETVGFKVSDM